LILVVVMPASQSWVGFHTRLCYSPLGHSTIICFVRLETLVPRWLKPLVGGWDTLLGLRYYALGYSNGLLKWGILIGILTGKVNQVTHRATPGYCAAANSVANTQDRR